LHPLKRMNPELFLQEKIAEALKELFGLEFSPNQISLQKTRPEFNGEFTLVTFPYIKISKKSPEQTGEIIGNWLKHNVNEINAFNVIKGFLNLSLNDSCWLAFFSSILPNLQYGFISSGVHSQSVMIEYPSPNTNKPLHLGHLRNIFLGASVSELLKACGNRVIHSCLYNDRGTNISKSMLAWQLFSEGQTPEINGTKPDHFVGDYYVKFANAYKAEIESLTAGGFSKEEAEKRSELNNKVNEMTVAWEKGDEEIRALWKKMNDWVYTGFNETYQLLGIKPDKFYYESDVYHLGKETVQEGLEKGVFFQKEDGSIWIDLTAEGLDQKVVLRSNGTSVYITQDIATANEKERDFPIDKSIYVVGNEQDYHFKVLFLILKKLGRSYADHLFHLSYGMVELPTGKMKSREGTVVDADDLAKEVIERAEEITRSQGRIEHLNEEEKKELFRMLGLGALKYFILKVDPKKKMVFNPEESVDLQGNTGPFIQYSHARIRSVITNGAQNEEALLTDSIPLDYSLQKEEKELLRLLQAFPSTVTEACASYSPALVANFVYELARNFNQFYHEHSVLKADSTGIRQFRLQLSLKTGYVIRDAMKLLGIDVPERM
jgi:arginyl-tRNA synthetase